MKKMRHNTEPRTLLMLHYKLCHVLQNVPSTDRLTREGEELHGWFRRLKRNDPDLVGSHKHWRKRTMAFLTKVKVRYKEYLLAGAMEIL